MKKWAGLVMGNRLVELIAIAPTDDYPEVTFLNRQLHQLSPKGNIVGEIAILRQLFISEWFAGFSAGLPCQAASSRAPTTA
jgi:hypothetical protein